jgi:hypothetical protein
MNNALTAPAGNTDLPIDMTASLSQHSWHAVLWRTDPLLIGDSVNNDRFWATAR